MKRLILALGLWALVAPGVARADIYRIGQSVVVTPNLTFPGTLTAGTFVVTGQAKFADGTAAAPSISFTSDTDTGFFYSPTLLYTTVGGAARFAVGSAGSYNLTGAFYLGPSSDVALARLAADHLSMARSTNPQKFSLMGTYTDGSNYERGYLSASTTGLIVGHESAGTGTDREVRINSASKNVAVFSGTVVTMTDETAVTVMSVTVPDNSMCQITFEYGNIVVSASEYQGHDGMVSLLVGEDPDAADSYACSVEEETEHVLASAGTLTDSWGCTAGATTTVAGTFNSTLDVAGSLTLNVTHSSGCVITIP